MVKLVSSVYMWVSFWVLQDTGYKSSYGQEAHNIEYIPDY